MAPESGCWLAPVMTLTVSGITGPVPVRPVIGSTYGMPGGTGFTLTGITGFVFACRVWVWLPLAR